MVKSSHIFGAAAYLAASVISTPVAFIPDDSKTIQQCQPIDGEVVNFDKAPTVLKFDNFDVSPEWALKATDFSSLTNPHGGIIAVSRKAEGSGDVMAGRFFTAGDWDFRLNSITIAGGMSRLQHFMAGAWITCYGYEHNQLEVRGKKFMNIMTSWSKIDFGTANEGTFDKCRSVGIVLTPPVGGDTTVYALAEVDVTKWQC